MYHHIEELPPSMVARFASAPVEVRPSGCVEWRGHSDRNGYGYVRATLNGRKYFTGAHRLAYLIAKSLIPDGLTIDHLCRNRLCINIEHLEAVSIQENIARQLPPTRSTSATCCRGHMWTAATTYIDRLGRRTCTICRGIRKVKYRQAGGIY